MVHARDGWLPCSPADVARASHTKGGRTWVPEWAKRRVPTVATSMPETHDDLDDFADADERLRPEPLTR